MSGDASPPSMGLMGARPRVLCLEVGGLSVGCLWATAQPFLWLIAELEWFRFSVYFYVSELRVCSVGRFWMEGLGEAVMGK